MKWLQRWLWGALFMPALTLAYTTPVVHDYQLPNGLTLLIQEDHRAPLALFEIWYHVGSSDEADGYTGISHMLEHMMFRGTAKYSGNQFTALITDKGGQQNAFTSYDYTGYYELIAKEQLPLAFELEADRMRGLLLDPTLFAKEQQVVMEERYMRTEDNPIAYLNERYMAVANIANPYAHPVVGWPGDITQFNVADLRNWYNQWYQPNNATIVVVGDVDPQQVYALAKQYFGKIPKAQVPERKRHEALPAVGQKQLSVARPAQVPALMMGFNVPVVKTDVTDNTPYVLLVIAALLSDGDSSRLTADLVRNNAIAAGVDASYDPFMRFNTTFDILAIPADKVTTEQLQQAIWQQLEQLKQQPVNAAELQRVIMQLSAEYVYSLDSVANEAEVLGSLVSVNLPWQLSTHYLDQLKQVTPAQIQTVAQRYFVPENSTIAVLVPQPGAKRPVQMNIDTGTVH